MGDGALDHRAHGIDRPQDHHVQPQDSTPGLGRGPPLDHGVEPGEDADVTRPHEQDGGRRSPQRRGQPVADECQGKGQERTHEEPTPERHDERGQHQGAAHGADALGREQHGGPRRPSVQGGDRHGGDERDERRADQGDDPDQDDGAAATGLGGRDPGALDDAAQDLPAVPDAALGGGEPDDRQRRHHGTEGHRVHREDPRRRAGEQHDAGEAGPMTRPTLNCADDNDTAPSRSSAGTRSGIMAW